MRPTNRPVARSSAPRARSRFRPVLAEAGELGFGLFSGHRVAAHVAHDFVVRVQPHEGVEVGVAPAAQAEAGSLELGHGGHLGDAEAGDVSTESSRCVETRPA